MAFYTRTASHTDKDIHLRLTLLAALLAMLGPFSIDTYLPSFPAIEAEFDINRTDLSHSLSVYLAGFGLATLFWGPLSDRYGRLLIISISLIGYLLASIGCALSTSNDLFLVFRALQGLAASGGFIAGRAMIRDAHSRNAAHRAMAQVMMMFAIAPAIAPIIGGWLQDTWGWRSNFWFLALFALTLLWIQSTTRETLPTEKRHPIHPRHILKTYQGMIQHGRFMLMVISMSCAFAGLFLYIAGAPSVVYDFLGLDTHHFYLLFVPMVGGMMIGSFISSRLSHQFSAYRLVTFGLALLLSAGLFNLIQTWLDHHWLWPQIAPLVIYTLGLAFIIPAITVLSLDCFPQNRGSAASVQGFVQMMLNAGVASMAVPLLNNRSSLFVYGQIGFLLCTVILWLLATHLLTLEGEAHESY